MIPSVFTSFILAAIALPYTIVNAGTIRAASSNTDTFLTVHNAVRAQHGAANLIWNDNLAATATNWANGCVFKHSNGPYGENLAAGTGSFTINDGVTLWADEASSYDANNPVGSHYTQMVWKSTKELGCAIVTCAPGTIFDASYGPAQYIVCEYYPRGNVAGQYAQNVQP